jgi:hypothetical protein
MLVTREDNCFDDIDNDSDGRMDCADSDCTGKTDGYCETGEPGACAAGTLQCQNGAAVCVPNSQQTAESIAGGNCDDTIDNDCDGLIDVDDPGCQDATGDVDLTRLQAPQRIYVKKSSNTTVQVVVEATATTEQLATVKLEASSTAGVTVRIAQASITKVVGTDDDVVTRFVFNATVYATQKGRWAVNWTAKIVSPMTSIQEVNTYDDDSDDEVLTATTQVVVTTRVTETIRELYAMMLNLQ